MPDLVTLQQVKRLIKTGTDDGSDDLLIRQLISTASKTAHEFCQRSFVPQWATRLYDARGSHIESRALNLDIPGNEPLLELTALTNGDGNAIALADTVLYPLNRYPKTTIRLKDSCNTPFTYSGDWQGAIQVSGVWGYHNAYSKAWIDTLDTVQDTPLIASTVSLTVANADGVDAYGHLRFEVLQYLKVDDEVLQVIAIDTTTNVLTVRRAALGTTAAEHAVTTAIRSYQPMEDVRMACTSLATWLYQTRESVGEKIQFLDGTMLVTNEAPANIKLTLEKYAVVRFGE